MALRARREHRSLAQQAVVELRCLLDLEGSQKRLRVLAGLKQEVAEKGAISLAISPKSTILEDRRNRRKALDRLFELFEGHDAEKEIRRLKQ
ncbi:MAG: hypothetical protein V3T83_15430 [Acidobacteriota bacterium]